MQKMITFNFVYRCLKNKSIFLFVVHTDQARLKAKTREHPDLNRGPLDLQSNALPLSYAPTTVFAKYHWICAKM